MQKKQSVFAVRNLGGLIVLVSVLFLGSCATLQELATFSKCEFRMHSLQDLTAAGVNISGRNSISQLKITDAAKLMAAGKTGSLPVSFVLNVEVKNPNSRTAALNKTDYIIYLDGKEMVSGSSSQRIEIPGNNQTALLPLEIHFDLLKMMDQSTLNSVLNLLFNLAGASTVPSQVTLKLKPSITLGNITIPYPGYLNVTKEFGAEAAQ